MSSEDVNNSSRKLESIQLADEWDFAWFNSSSPDTSWSVKSRICTKLSILVGNIYQTNAVVVREALWRKVLHVISGWYYLRWAYFVCKTVLQKGHKQKEKKKQAEFGGENFCCAKLIVYKSEQCDGLSLACTNLFLSEFILSSFFVLLFHLVFFSFEGGILFGFNTFASICHKAVLLCHSAAAFSPNAGLQFVL